MGVTKQRTVQANAVDLCRQTGVESVAEGDKPVSFVFHGGSGSSADEIREAISYGVIKMNIDTDTQWAFWNGVRRFYLDNVVGKALFLINDVIAKSPFHSAVQLECLTMTSKRGGS